MHGRVTVMEVSLAKVRATLARYDSECSSGLVPHSAASRKRDSAHNAFDAMLETANAVCAGTPFALVSGGVSAAVGLAKIVLARFFLPLLNKEATNRAYASGAKLLLAGAAATVPVYGTYFNVMLAAKDAADTVNLLKPNDTYGR